MIEFIRQKKILILVVLITLAGIIGIGYQSAEQKSEPIYRSKIDRIMYDTHNQSPKYVITLPDRNKKSKKPKNYIINIINKKTAPISRSSFKFMLSVLYYSTILSTTPAPTVRPPSLIANLIPCSIATGAINSTSITTLSPGITISPSNLIEPVTSVVLM
mgnify:CR=1 FL=1